MIESADRCRVDGDALVVRDIAQGCRLRGVALYCGPGCPFCVGRDEWRGMGKVTQVEAGPDSWDAAVKAVKETYGVDVPSGDYELEFLSSGAAFDRYYLKRRVRCWDICCGREVVRYREIEEPVAEKERGK